MCADGEGGLSIAAGENTPRVRPVQLHLDSVGPNLVLAVHVQQHAAVAVLIDREPELKTQSVVLVLRLRSQVALRLPGTDQHPHSGLVLPHGPHILNFDTFLRSEQLPAFCELQLKQVHVARVRLRSFLFVVRGRV